MAGTIRVLVADDHPVIRESLAAFLREQPELEVVGMAADGQQAVALAAAQQPDVVLMDVEMPVLNGVEATKRLQATQPQCRIVLLTMFAHESYVLGGVRAGAMGYLLKGGPSADIVTAVQAAHRGEALLQPSVAATVLATVARLPDGRYADPSQGPLSDRERAVLRLVAQGNSNQEIGDRLHYDENSVKNRLRVICRKLEAKDRAHAVAIGKDLGLI